MRCFEERLESRAMKAQRTKDNKYSICYNSSEEAGKRKTGRKGQPRKRKRKITGGGKEEQEDKVVMSMATFLL